MRHLGAIDVVLTGGSNQSEIDADSSRYIVRTKNSTEAVRRSRSAGVAGVCVADGRRGLFFTSGTFAAAAVEFADHVGIPLLIYSAQGGTLNAANPNAQVILTRGL